MDPSKDFKPGQHVRYIPSHANHNASHPDCLNGVVTSVTPEFVFVRYGSGSTSAATRREDLR